MTYPFEDTQPHDGRELFCASADRDDCGGFLDLLVRVSALNWRCHLLITRTPIEILGPDSAEDVLEHVGFFIEQAPAADGADLLAVLEGKLDFFTPDCE